MKKLIKENVKLVLVAIITAIICISGTVLAESVINANQIGYNNTTVKDALDGMYRINSFQTDYSTEEKVVGRWIDGKPLYQKTITELVTPNASYGKIYGMDNIEVINYSGILYGSNTNITISGSNFGGSHSEYFDIWSDGGSFYVCTDSSHYNKSMILTIQYTKTTDTAQ